MNALKNCTKTAAKITGQNAIYLDEFRHVRSGCLEFYTNRARPPLPFARPCILISQANRVLFGTMWYKCKQGLR